MTTPLSEQMRPASFADVVGQEHLVGPKGWITRVVQTGKPLSIILWGPPGCGKTSLARLYAKAFNTRFESLSAVFSGLADLKKIITDMQKTPLLGRSLLLFVDEIHRFNKAQQDAFLPLIEEGTIILVGATAENPSFYLNNALLSRLRVLQLHALDELSLDKILQQFEKQRGDLSLESTARLQLIQLAQGDGRYLLNLVENIASASGPDPLTGADLEQLLQRRAPLFDRMGDQHYDLISALHKSIRGSDPDASLYWLARMVEAGEDPLFLARRLIRIASEDIGLADPQALALALSARKSYELLGSPEGELALAQACIYLALAPKSRSVEAAFTQARDLARQTSQLRPPSTILNAHTSMMKQMGYGRGYQYDHDTICGFSGQAYFPEKMGRPSLYHPVERGFEREMKKRLDYFSKLRDALSHPSDKPADPL